MIKTNALPLIWIVLSGIGCGVGVMGESSDTRSITTAVISGVTFGKRCVEVEEVDGEAIFEGDVIVGKVEDVVQPCKVGETIETDEIEGSRAANSLVIKGERYRWPDGKVPFFVSNDLSDATKQRIAQAIEHWHAKTKIRFVRRTNESAYVTIIAQEENCTSYIGRIGGAQALKLSPKCSKLNIIHELGHAVGFWHEQSRADRDQYVTIQWANVEKGKEHNFKQHISDGTDVGGYDYGSRMHYTSHTFSTNGKPTIVAKDPKVVLNNNEGLSEGDIQGVEAIYPGLTDRAADCSACTPGGNCESACKLSGLSGGTCGNPGSADPENCCICDDGNPPEQPKPTLPPPAPTAAKPFGYFDDIKDGVARGWACDLGDPTATIDVHIYVGGPAGSGKGHVTVANRDSATVINDLCGGGTAHRFQFEIPDWTKQAGQKVHAYAIGIDGKTNSLLEGSPATIPQGPTTPEPNPQPDPGPTAPAPIVEPNPNPPSAKTPIGYLDSVDGGLARGWACDPDDSNASIVVHVYVGGPAGSGASAVGIMADRSSEEAVAQACGGGNAHRFQLQIPNWEAKKGQFVYAYAIDLTGGKNPLLTAAPKKL